MQVDINELNGEEIVSRIRKTTYENGMRIKDLCARSGVSSTAMTLWSKGERKPSAKSLHDIANALGVSYEYLITGDEEQKNAATKTGDGDEVTLQKVVEFMKGLDTDQLRYLKQWADVLTFEQEHK